MSSTNIPLKLLRGYKDNLPSTIEDGMIYYCIDSNELFFDYVNNSTTPPTEHRYCLNPMVGETDYGDPVGKGLVSPEDKEIIDTAIRFVEQQLEPEQQKQARLNINAVGEKTLEGGEIFNDYENNEATQYAHSEGTKTIAKGYSSHAEGGIYGASSSNPNGYSHTLTANDYPTFLTEDVTIYGSIANGNNSHAEGGGTYAHSEGSHAEGAFTLAMGYGSHSEGYGTQATGYVAHAEGYATKATQQAAHAEGNQTKATAQAAHAEGNYTEASGYYSHAEGYNTEASGYQSHAEGSNTKATASCAHAEGYYTEAADYSHSEGGYTKAIGNYSHSEGQGTEAQGVAAHVEGWESIASGNYSHAGGYRAKALGECSHAEGYCTIANGNYQHVQGKHNIEDTENKFVHIVGNGEYQMPSNAHTLDWNGNAWFAGNIRIGGTSYETGEEPGAKPYMTKVTLTTSGWDPTALTQVATIEGIKADETAQAIYINPVFDDTMIDEIGNCNVYASAQGENSITFSCDSIPTIDIEFYVKWQDVKWI